MAIQKYKGHLALLGAAIMWGLMSPIGKTALENGISGLSLATFRMTGGAVCFWIASIFAPKEQVKPHDLMMLFFAGLLGIVPESGMFYFRTITDFPHRCFHCNNHSPYRHYD